MRGATGRDEGLYIQGYLADKKRRPPRTLQQDFSWGPMVALGGGLFLMNQVPL